MAFGALSSGISALNSFSKGMEVIGNNIANVNTVSFKSSRISYSETFNQVLRQSAPSPSSGDKSNVQASQVGLGVQVEGVVGVFSQGGLSSTSQLTDLAISGEGYFLVEDPKTGTQFATRGGDFRIDDQGYLVTAGGMRVQGLTGGSIGFHVSVDGNGDWTFAVNEDTQTGTISPYEFGDIRLDYNVSDAELVDEAYLTGQQTRNSVMYTNELLGGETWGGIGTITSGEFNVDEVVYGTADTSHRVGGFVYGGLTEASDGTQTATSIEGVTGWHTFMEEAVANLKTLRNVSDQGKDGSGITDADIEQAVSTVFYHRMFGDEIDADAAAGVPINIDGNEIADLFADLTFDTSGVDKTNTLATIDESFPDGLADAKALVNTVMRQETPELSRFSVDDEGSVVYFLSNGESYTRGQIQLVDFYDDTALIREGQGLYSGFGAAGLKDNPYGTNEQGLTVAGTNGLGSIKQGALELSNVDLTQQFADMITTQRGFQAGSRVITVSDEILQEVVNLKR